jgi:hypothetical protein
MSTDPVNPKSCTNLMDKPFTKNNSKDEIEIEAAIRTAS